MNPREKLLHTTELSHLWGQAERLCNDLCHALEWTRDGDDVRRLNRLLSRARARSLRRYDRYRNWYKYEL